MIPAAPFDLGTGRYAAPPREDDAAALAKVKEGSARERKARDAQAAGERTHSEVQGWIRDLGRALGYDVWIARNDRTRPFGGGRLGDECLETLPSSLESGGDYIPLIDVLWLERGGAR